MSDFTSVSSFHMELVDEEGQADRVTVQIGTCVGSSPRTNRVQPARMIRLHETLHGTLAGVLC